MNHVIAFIVAFMLFFMVHMCAIINGEESFSPEEKAKRITMACGILLAWIYLMSQVLFR